LNAWHLVRDQGLFSPWYAHTGSSAIRQEPQVAPARVHRGVLDLFRSNGAWQRAFRAQYSYPWRKKLKLATQKSYRIILAASAIEPLRESTWRVAEAVPEAVKVALPDSERRWAASLLKSLA